MLGIWADNTDVSLFAVAWRTAVLITFVLLAVNTTAQPKFAELFARREKQSLGHGEQSKSTDDCLCSARFPSLSRRAGIRNERFR